MPRRIMVVDDSGIMADTLRRLLPGQRFTISRVDRAWALREAANDSLDLVVLDGRLAPEQTVALARGLRQQVASARIVAVVPSMDLARDDSSRITYLSRLPAEEELVAWLGQEGEDREARVLRVGAIALDLDTHELDVNGQITILTPKQFKLLSLFMSRPGQILTRKQLMKDVWETDYTGDTRTLDVHIHWVREKLGDVPGQPKYLQTVRRVGYRFVDPNDPLGSGPGRPG